MPLPMSTRSTRRSRVAGASAFAALVTLSLATVAPVHAQFAREADGPERVLLTLDEALDEVFPRHDAVRSVVWRPTAEQRSALEERLGRRLYEPRFEILEVMTGTRVLGYAVQTDERGKYRPITFLVGVTPEFRVQDTAIMVYRESRGGEVERKRFLQQYRGKSGTDPVRINRDIINISGATISVRSVNAGVRKVLAVVETWSSAQARQAGSDTGGTATAGR